MDTKTGPRPPREPLGGPKGGPEPLRMPQGPPKAAPKRLRELSHASQRRSSSDQGPPKSAQGSANSPQNGVSEAQNRARGACEDEKCQFRGKCFATRPCRCARHFGPPKSIPDRPEIVPSRPVGPLELLLRSTLVPRRHLERPQRVTRGDSGRLGGPQGSPKVDSSLPGVRAKSGRPPVLIG